MTKNEGRVYFSLDGEAYNPEDVTSLIALKPSETKVKGSRIPDAYPAMTTWQFSSEKIICECVDVYEMSASVVKILKPKKAVILEAINRFNLRPRLQVVLSFSMDETLSTPILGYDKATLQFLADIGAFIDIDTYKH